MTKTRTLLLAVSLMFLCVGMTTNAKAAAAKQAFSQGDQQVLVNKDAEKTAVGAKNTEQPFTQACRGEATGLVTNADLTAATLSGTNAENMAGAAKKVFAATAEVKVEKKNAQFVEIGFLKRAITSQQFGVTTGGTYSVILPNKVAAFTDATQPFAIHKEVAHASHLAVGIASVTAHFAQMANCLTKTAGAAMVT